MVPITRPLYFCHKKINALKESDYYIVLAHLWLYSINLYYLPLRIFILTQRFWQRNTQAAENIDDANYDDQLVVAAQNCVPPNK
jgi:hypothetical protein